VIRTATAAGLLLCVWMSPCVHAADETPNASALTETLKRATLNWDATFYGWTAAKALAAKHGPDSILHVARRASEEWRSHGRYLFLVLAALGNDDRARDLLRDWSLREDRASGVAVFAISFMPPERAAPVLEQVLLEGANARARHAAGRLLVWLGDEDTLARLRRVRPQEAAKSEVSRTADALAKWLKRFPAGEARRERARQEVVFWQAVRGAPPFRSVSGAYAFAANDLAKHGEKLSAAFLHWPPMSASARTSAAVSATPPRSSRGV